MGSLRKIKRTFIILLSILTLFSCTNHTVTVYGVGDVFVNDMITFLYESRELEEYTYKVNFSFVCKEEDEIRYIYTTISTIEKDNHYVCNLVKLNGEKLDNGPYFNHGLSIGNYHLYLEITFPKEYVNNYKCVTIDFNSFGESFELN